MKINLIKTLFVGLCGLFLFSCGGGSEKKKETKDNNSEFEAARAKVVLDFQKVMADVPPPSEIPYMLQQAGADFDPSIVNTTSKVGGYITNPQKAALNLGVYSADIAYLASYGDADIALDYMGECQKLAVTIGIEDAIDFGMVSRFEQNIENKDSLAIIVNEIMLKSGEELAQLDQLEGFALLLAGSWIEGLYLTNDIIDNYPNELPEDLKISLLTPLVKIVLEQKQSLNDVLKVMKDITESEAVNNVIDDLLTIKAVYDNELVTVEKAIAENEGNFVLTPDVLTNLSNIVHEIRAGIVQ